MMGLISGAYGAWVLTWSSHLRIIARVQAADGKTMTVTHES